MHRTGNEVCHQGTRSSVLNSPSGAGSSGVEQRSTVKVVSKHSKEEAGRKCQRLTRIRKNVFVLIKECIGRATKFVISENHSRTEHLQIGQAPLEE